MHINCISYNHFIIYTCVKPLSFTLKGIQGKAIYQLYLNKTGIKKFKKEDAYILCVCTKSLQLCLTLCDPLDHSPPGSSVRRILEVRILEWVAVL